jgi:hypothetical protein
MIIEEFLKLPPFVHYEGIEFTPEIINDGGKEVRLCYKISSVAADSPHKMTVEVHGCWPNNLADPVNPPHQGFLKLYEGIYTDADLIWAIKDCWFWLVEKNLMEYTR